LPVSFRKCSWFGTSRTRRERGTISRGRIALGTKFTRDAELPPSPCLRYGTSFPCLHFYHSGRFNMIFRHNYCGGCAARHTPLQFVRQKLRHVSQPKTVPTKRNRRPPRQKIVALIYPRTVKQFPDAMKPTGDSTGRMKFFQRQQPLSLAINSERKTWSRTN
jgi:hypothetical protein